LVKKSATLDNLGRPLHILLKQTWIFRKSVVYLLFK